MLRASREQSSTTDYQPELLKGLLSALMYVVVW
jgi:hypothetical protein